MRLIYRRLITLFLIPSLFLEPSVFATSLDYPTPVVSNRMELFTSQALASLALESTRLHRLIHTGKRIAASWSRLWRREASAMHAPRVESIHVEPIAAESMPAEVCFAAMRDLPAWRLLPPMRFTTSTPGQTFELVPQSQPGLWDVLYEGQIIGLLFLEQHQDTPVMNCKELITSDQQVITESIVRWVSIGIQKEDLKFEVHTTDKQVARALWSNFHHVHTATDNGYQALPMDVVVKRMNRAEEQSFQASFAPTAAVKAQREWREAAAAFEKVWTSPTQGPGTVLDLYQFDLKNWLRTDRFNSRNGSAGFLVARTLKRENPDRFLVTPAEVLRVRQQAELFDYIATLAVFAKAGGPDHAKANLLEAQRLLHRFQAPGHPWSVSVVHDLAEAMQIPGSAFSDNETQQFAYEQFYLEMFAGSNVPNEYSLAALAAFTRHLQSQQRDIRGANTEFIRREIREVNMVDYAVIVLHLNQALSDYLRLDAPIWLALKIVAMIASDAPAFTDRLQLEAIHPDFSHPNRFYPNRLGDAVIDSYYLKLYEARAQLSADLRQFAQHGKQAIASLFGQVGLFSYQRLAAFWLAKLYDPAASRGWSFAALNYPNVDPRFIPWIRAMEAAMSRMHELRVQLSRDDLFDAEEGLRLFESALTRIEALQPPHSPHISQGA